MSAGVVSFERILILKVDVALVTSVHALKVVLEIRDLVEKDSIAVGAMMKTRNVCLFCANFELFHLHAILFELFVLVGMSLKNVILHLMSARCDLFAAIVALPAKMKALLVTLQRHQTKHRLITKLTDVLLTIVHRIESVLLTATERFVVGVFSDAAVR